MGIKPGVAHIHIYSETRFSLISLQQLFLTVNVVLWSISIIGQIFIKTAKYWANNLAV